jgi:hypothetical protein
MPGGLPALDGPLMLFAEPVMPALEGHPEDALFGAHFLRSIGAVVGFVLGIALIVVWNLEHDLPKT